MNLLMSYMTPLSPMMLSAITEPLSAPTVKCVRPSAAKDMIRPLAAAATLHVVDDDGRIAGNVFFQIGNEWPQSNRRSSRRIGAEDHRKRFSLVERGISGSGTGPEK